MVGQKSMEFRIVHGVWARHVEGRFHCRPGRGRKTPPKRDVKDKIKVQVDGIELRQVVEPVEWFAGSFFNALNELDHFVDR